jgi:predicted Zn-dependent protease
MKLFSFLFAILGTLFVSSAMGAELRLPSFLPGYYRPVFDDGKGRFAFFKEQETNGVSQFLYSIGRNEVLSVENVKGDGPACRAAFNNIVAHLNLSIQTNKGVFVEVTETELHAEIGLTNMSQTVFAFVLPKGVTIWTHSTSLISPRQFHPDYQQIRSLANRQRFEDAMREGNVSMGAWQKSIHSFSKELLKAGRKRDGIAVLKNLVSTSPFDYEAHLDLIENAPDSVDATNSAKVVVKNAEDQVQISRAAGFIGIEPPALDKFPLLSTNDTGMEVILIPLPPCNAWLLDDAAKVFERITDVPVRIRRLQGQWSWGAPDRIARQRYLEGFLVRQAKQNIDFKGWNGERYLKALTDDLKSMDPLSRYLGQDLIEKIKSEPGQYLADPYIAQFSRAVMPNRSTDARTMYVGITEANIYLGDNNFVFSAGTASGRDHVCLLSYAMMLGKATGQEFDSRARLVERIAKGLVPASLTQLGIPRSTDPSCPYSYASGVDRLDQKTLTLSDPVKQELNKFKAAARTANVQ